MKICNGPSRLLVQLIYITFFPVFVAQRVEVSPEVTGYLGHDVTLHCQLIQGPTHTNIAHVQWFLLEEGGTGKKKVALIAFNSVFGVNIFESPLKERVAFNEHSLIIKDVKMKDAGSYTCEITTFPSGTFEGTTKLVVQENMPPSAGMVFTIVAAAVLLLAIIAAVAYFVHSRRRHSSARLRVVIDTNGPEIDEAQLSVTARNEDVVYSDIKLKPFRNASPSFNCKLRDSVDVDDVTYSAVIFSHKQSKPDTEYV
ncbi:nectin-4-like [Oreochromis niloticus]|uniref:nectin-4-like n=1 Tax=Oreochromis niloticus TaxID=8128 RepID=UPI000DF3AD70|nr:nectin-4-like [Oreochromis niloticus]